MKFICKKGRGDVDADLASTTPQQQGGRCEPVGVTAERIAMPNSYSFNSFIVTLKLFTICLNVNRGICFPVFFLCSSPFLVQVSRSSFLHSLIQHGWFSQFLFSEGLLNQCPTLACC